MYHFTQQEEPRPPYAPMEEGGGYDASNQGYEMPLQDPPNLYSAGETTIADDLRRGQWVSADAAWTAANAQAAYAPMPQGWDQKEGPGSWGAGGGDMSASGPTPTPRPGAGAGAGAGTGAGIADVGGMSPSGPAPATRATAEPKSKRSRTGCLTCRDRHIKCDESGDICSNCKRSNRECKRGFRLNFTEVKVEPINEAPTDEWRVEFRDESRQIASEYQGGLEKYPPLEQEELRPPREIDPWVIISQAMTAATEAASGIRTSASQPQADQAADASVATLGHRQAMGGKHGLASTTTLPDQFSSFGEGFQLTHAVRSSDASSVASSMVPQGMGPPSNASFRTESGPNQPNVPPPDGQVTPPSEKATGERNYLDSPDEIYYMQIFVEHVGVWMDSLDKEKHFSRIIPYLALKSPMLLNAFLACGVMQLTLIDPECSDEKALVYYDTASAQLLRSLQNPDRDTAECATTAVVLNVYEIMSEKPKDRMNHIAGARALIKECGWDAKSTGIGAACFWLNVGMEVLSCLSFNWPTAWDPDQWGLDLDFTKAGAGDDGSRWPKASSSGRGDCSSVQNFLAGSGEEEAWARRIFYILAKVANFRAGIPRFQEPSPHDEQVRQQNRFSEWKRLIGLCDTWSRNCPRSMRPFGYLKRANDSVFPHVWLMERSAVVGRLYYHTAMILLHQINPLEPRDSEDNQKTQMHHAHQVCGIVSYTKDRGVSSVAIQSLTIAASVLKDRREQEEIFSIFDNIKTETGWRIGKIYKLLRKTWRWPDETESSSGAAVPTTAAPPPVPNTSWPASTTTSASNNAASSNLAPAPPHFLQAPYMAAAGPSSAASMMSAAMTPAPLEAPLPLPVPTGPSPFATNHPAPAVQRAGENPLLNADFGNPNGPYKAFYRPPNELGSFHPRMS